MPQYQDFGFQLPPRLEAVPQHADEKEAHCNHVTIVFLLTASLGGWSFRKRPRPGRAAYHTLHAKIVCRCGPDANFLPRVPWGGGGRACPLIDPEFD